MAKPTDPPHDTAAIRAAIKVFLDSKDVTGKRIGSYKYGVYAFYDFDKEPIYVGQTYEGLGARIGRHLTNQRTDAVAMNVLDPFEVAEIEVWPMPMFGVDDPIAYLNNAEFTVFEKLLAESTFGAVLNEKEMPTGEPLALPNSIRDCIIPVDLYDKRKHPDLRLARRASTIAALARVISERKPSKGLRRTLLVQAQRLEALAKVRLSQFDAAPEEPAD